MERTQMTRKTAMNILQSRAVVSKPTVISNVEVTNVSFTDQEGQPFVWEDTSESAGEPYAIANFNLMNTYGKEQAQSDFSEGNYQDACNHNLSARVSLEKGRELVNSLIATVKVDYREIDVKDDNGEPTGETEQALLIAKVVPSKAPSANDLKMSDFDFGTEEDNSGAPQAQPATTNGNVDEEEEN